MIYEIQDGDVLLIGVGGSERVLSAMERVTLAQQLAQSIEDLAHVEVEPIIVDHVPGLFAVLRRKS